MRVLITGATGFLGRATVDAVLKEGHEVVALHRPGSSPSDGNRPQGKLRWLAADLREPGNWSSALEQVDAVIHCAAAASGDLHTQLLGTVLGTENLLQALPPRVRRFVHVSSLSVYDFDKPRFLGLLTENTPLESLPLRRDAYTQTKLLQEQLVRDFARTRQMPLVVARPGAIYGPGRSWDWGRALRAGPFDLVFAPLTPMRLVHVDNCARALSAALTFEVDREVCINLIDAEQPSHMRYYRMGRRAGAKLGLPVPVPYWMVLTLGVAARVASKVFFRGHARLPELLDLPRQRVRWRPLRYSRKRAENLLSSYESRTLQDAVKELAAAGRVATLRPDQNAMD